MKLLKLKSQLNEEQKLKLLKTESMGFHIAMIGLTIDYFVKLLLLLSVESWIGEFILIEGLCIYMVISGLINGIWSRYFQPGIKYYFVSSFLAGAAVGVSALIFSMIHGPFEDLAKEIFKIFGVMFSFCFISMLVLGKIYKHRKRKLDMDNCMEAENEISEVKT